MTTPKLKLIRIPFAWLLLVQWLTPPYTAQAGQLAPQAGTVTQRFAFKGQKGFRLVPGTKTVIPLGSVALPVPGGQVTWSASLEAEFSLPAAYAALDFPSAAATASYNDLDVHPGKTVNAPLLWNATGGTVEINSGLGVAEALATVTWQLCTLGYCAPAVTETYQVGTCDLAVTVPATAIPAFGGSSVSDTFLMLQFSVPFPGFSLDFGVEGEAVISLLSQKIRDTKWTFDGANMQTGPGWTANGQPITFPAAVDPQAAIGKRLPFHMEYAYLADLGVQVNTKSVFTGISVGLPCLGASYSKAVPLPLSVPVLSLRSPGFWNIPSVPAALDFDMSVVNRAATASVQQVEFKQGQPGQLTLRVDDPDGAQEEIELCVVSWGDGSNGSCAPQRMKPGSSYPFGHTYAQGGYYTVGVRVRDHHQAVADLQFIISVEGGGGGGGGGGCPPWKCDIW